MSWRRNVGATAVCLVLVCTSLALADSQQRPSRWTSISDALANADGSVTGFVRIRDNLVVPANAGCSEAARPLSLRSRDTDACCSAPAGFGLEAYAWNNQSSPEDGTLSPMAWGSSVGINNNGLIAFVSVVNGIDRNQGIFISDHGVLTAIVKGCGGGGGSGDPGSAVGDASPIGGTFTGFFQGTAFTPSINDAGDVLFLADVDGGSAARALFLYRGSNGTIDTVAAIGDACPTGGTFTEVGVGSLNNNAVVAFAARDSISDEVNIYKWDAGTVTKVVAVGDAVPSGGVISNMVTEAFGFADGTWIPTGPCPGINDAGQVSFSAILTAAPAARGLFVSTAGVHELYVSTNDATPINGTYSQFYAPQINNNGEIAFFAYVNGGDSNAAWFAGTPATGYRNVLAFGDDVEGYSADGLSISRNPMRALDDCGNVVLWTWFSNGELDAQVLVTADGEKKIIATQGDITPPGGSIGWINGWPSINSARQGVLSCDTFGAPGNANNTHFVYTGWMTGDLDGDNDVDLADLQILLSSYGDTETSYQDGDLDGDGDVDLADLQLLLAAYGVSCA